MREDLETLTISVIVVILIFISCLPRSINSAMEIFASNQALIKNSPISEFKKNEKTFWANLKGNVIQSDSSIFANLIANNTAVTPAPTPLIVTPPPKPPKQKYPLKFLLVGDSMMLNGFGPEMESKLLTYYQFSVVREGRFSTGLNRIDYFDWYSYTDQLINENKPDVLVVIFGANDGQGITDNDGNAVWLDDGRWNDVYRSRVDAFMSLVTERVKHVYWVGHPIPNTDEFYQKFSRMNAIYSEEAKKFGNITYINEWDRFAVNGQYSAVVTADDGTAQTVKESDGVHVTLFGGQIMADEVIKAMNEDIFMLKPEDVITPTPSPTVIPTETPIP